MGKVDRSLFAEIVGTRTDPKVPGHVPTGDFFRILLTFQNDLQPLKDAGFIPGIVFNDMATGVIPVGMLGALENHPNVVRVDLDRRLNYRLENSRPEVKADKVQKPPQGSGVMGYDGTGVVVGIIDNGFEYRHRTFRKGNNGTGGTRILRLWDQTWGQWQPNLDYGKKYTQQQIDDALTNFSDPAKRIPYTSAETHGTHVAGIAAGGGWMEDGSLKYVGVAPGADLMMVETTVDFTGGMLVEAIAYIAQQAEALGKRCVINMSLGYPGYACDGYAPLDRCMNAIAAEYPNLVLVASAGNNGGYDFHAEGDVTAQPLQLPVTIWGEPCNIYLWHAGNENFTLTITPPSNSNQAPGKVYTPKAAPDPLKWPAGNVVTVTSEVHPFNDKRCTTLMFRPGQRDTVAAGVWWLTVSGPPQINGKVHAWIDFDMSQHQEYRPGFLTATPGATVETPGSAEQVIAAASYVTRNTKTMRQFDMGVLSFFSSRGPLLGPALQPAGRIKPDIAAPGHIIRSATARLIDNKTDAVIDGTHGEAGTSMASPHVAGVIALLLQKEPGLTRQQVFDRITQTARSDAQTGSVPNTSWGFGKIDAWAALFPPAQANAGGPQAESIVAEEYRRPLSDLGDAMARSAEGRAYLDFLTRHRDEIVELIRRHRRINAAWLRAGAPAVHAFLTSLRTPELPLPAAIHGRSLRRLIQRFLGALRRYGSDELKAAVTALGDPLPADGLTIHQIRARFEQADQACHR